MYLHWYWLHRPSSLQSTSSSSDTGEGHDDRHDDDDYQTTRLPFLLSDKCAMQVFELFLGNILLASGSPHCRGHTGNFQPKQPQATTGNHSTTLRFPSRHSQPLPPPSPQLLQLPFCSDSRSPQAEKHYSEGAIEASGGSTSTSN